MKHILSVFGFLVVLLAAQSSNAQLWQQTNGVGTDGINSIAVAPNGHIFLSGRSMIRSTDGGTSWVWLSGNLEPNATSRLIAQPSGRLIASYDGSTLFPIGSSISSDDDGQTWKALPITNATLWQSAGGVLLARKDDVSPELLLRSTDDGDSWAVISLTGVDGGFYRPYETTSGVLFVIGNYLYRSTDQGASWGKVLNGFPGVFEAAQLFESPEGTIFYGGGEAITLYRSDDGGRIWSPVSSYPKYLTGLIALDRSGKMVITFGDRTFFAPHPDSEWWQLPAPNGLRLGSVVVASDAPGSFLFAIGDELYRLQPPSAPVRVGASNGKVMTLCSHPSGSVIAFDAGASTWSEWGTTDGGNHWNYQSGYSASVAALDSSDDILIGTGGTILRSADTGRTFKSVSPVLTNGIMTGLAVGSNGDIFLSSSTEGIFRSTDRGATWDQLTSGMPTQDLYSLAVAPNGDVFVGSNASIYHSTNDGLTWSSLNANLPATAGKVTSLVVNAQGAIIAGVQNVGIYWSTDNGATWNQKATGFSAKNVNTLLATPSGKVFAGTEAGVFFLDTAAGSSWIPYSLGITAPNVLSLCRDNAGRIYAGTDGSGVFRSVQTFNKIIPADAPTITQTIGQITFPRAPLGTTRDTILDGIIASTDSNPLEVYGVKLIADAGQTGDFSIANPLPFPFTVSDGKPLSLTVSAHPQTYGTSHAMLYLYTNAPEAVSTVELVATATDQSSVGAEHNSRSGETCELYPNPAASTFKINLSSSGFGVADVRVHDCLGRVVLTQHEHVSAEMSTIEVSTASLHDGAYYVEVRTPDGRSVTTPIVIRK